MKISILGGGGTRTPLLLKGLLSLEEELELEELSFMDMDEQRLLLVKRVLDEIAREGKGKLRLTYTQDIRESIREASFVICAIRVGGERLRIIDERVPLRFGVFGQETTGPGGFSMAVRTIPRVWEITNLLAEVNPKAWFINFTNPSGVVTQAILGYSSLKKVVGICDAPSSIHKVIAQFLNKKEEEVFTDYFGLNHFGWIKGVYVDGEDVLPSILELIKDLPDFERITRFPGEFSALIKMLPNPYLYYYYFKEEATKDLLRAERTRGEIVEEMNAKLFHSLREGSNPLSIYLDYIKEREASFMPGRLKGIALAEGEGYIDVALKVIKGLAKGDAEVAIVNTRNLTAISGLEEDDVVEVPTLFRKDFLRPLSAGKIPAESLAMLKQLKEYERLLIEGVATSSYSTLLHALTLNPWVPSYHIAKKILDAFIEEEQEYFPHPG
ncbi:MAG: putative 6-phospho-beta-glucosidase [Actinobacteria bacterium]|nr:putative 6-phospho-beta-glucosidase [Actinomycetota bacterium]